MIEGVENRIRSYWSLQHSCKVTPFEVSALGSIADTNEVFKLWGLDLEMMIDHCTIIDPSSSFRKTLTEYVNLCTIHPFFKTIDWTNVFLVELKP